MQDCGISSTDALEMSQSCTEPSIWCCYGIVSCFNSLWPSDTIRGQGTKSTLAQVMACCLTAPSHYMITWTNVDLSSVRSCGIHQRALSWEDLKMAISKTRLKIIFLEPHSDLPGANELTCCSSHPSRGAYCCVSRASSRASSHLMQLKESWGLFSLGLSA